MLTRCRNLRVPALCARLNGLSEHISSLKKTHFVSGGNSSPFHSACPPQLHPPTPAIRFMARSASEMAGGSSKEEGSVYDFNVKNVMGNDVDLGMYKGKVLLIVNVASKCGLTDANYTELSQLYDMYRSQGLEILAFPCNQFGGEEPGTNEQILEFACTRYKAEYPIFDKVDVNGDNAAPLYKFLKSSRSGLFGESIKWNFAKFLVDKNGHVVNRFAPTTSPLSIEEDIKKLLEIS